MSIWWNVRSVKCLVSEMSGWWNVWLVKCLVGEMSGWWNVYLVKCLFGEMSIWWNIYLVKCLVGEMSGWWSSSTPHKGRPFELTHKRYTSLGGLASDKHCSLLQKSINYGQKKFYNIGPRWNGSVMWPPSSSFSTSTTARQKRGSGWAGSGRLGQCPSPCVGSTW